MGCDPREQKPKVAFEFSAISQAHAQQADRVVPPAAIAGAMARVDETFALYAASALATLREQLASAQKLAHASGSTR